jgi:hypothetical protein
MNSSFLYHCHTFSDGHRVHEDGTVVYEAVEVSLWRENVRQFNDVVQPLADHWPQR